ncbi:hypothetical protein AAIH42_34465, partial [Pseudomonas aeruginosa]
MALTVNTNIASLNTQRNLNNSSASLNTSLQRLSTGSRSCTIVGLTPAPRRPTI